MVSLLEVVSSAEQLNVLGDDRSAAPGVGDDVIEVQLVRGSAHDTSTMIALPHL
jgi:hypothetical protein